MAETNNNGCFSPILFIFLMVSSLTSFLTFAGISSSETVPIDAQIATPTIELVLSPIAESVTQDDLQSTIDVLDQRLSNLQANEQITVFEIEQGSNNQIIIRLDEGEVGQSDVIPLLTSNGNIEFVDFSDVENDALQSYVGTTIVTSATDENMQDAFPTILTSADMAGAEVFIDDFGNHSIEITLNDEGAQRLGTFTESNISNGMAIVLDNTVLTVPIIQSRIESPIVLSGLFTEEEANTLAIQLDSQPLPKPLELVSITQLP